MAPLMVELALDPPSPSELLPAVRLMQIENRIAEGIFNVEDWWSLERMSSPSGLNCPNCRSALYELNDKRMLRFRCRSGHTFTAQSLLSGQAEARETLLSTIFGCLIEEATLLKRMAKDPRIFDYTISALELNTRAQVLEREAEDVCTW
jgi:two-component system, chemotaxis family, protein-glutamate methylesterase/glutaminase